MALLNYIVLILIGFAFVVLIAGFFVVIPHNMRQGRVFRRQLATKIETTRIGKVLKAFGIDVDSYLHHVPVNQINASVKNCGVCTTTDECDDRLQKGNIKDNEIAYCANQEQLVGYKRAGSFSPNS